MFRFLRAVSSWNSRGPRSKSSIRRSLMLESRSSQDVLTSATAADMMRGMRRQPSRAAEKMRAPGGNIESMSIGNSFFSDRSR